MKKSYLSIFVILILSSGILSAVSSAFTDHSAVEQSRVQTHSLSGFDPHSPISIYGDNEFNQTATNEGWKGNGSASNPFIIEGYAIQNQYVCISIRYTDYYFIVKNCSLTTSSGTDYSSAVSFWDIPHGTLDSCFIFDKVVGISMSDSHGCSILNNTIHDVTYFGIELWKCTDFTFANNTFIDTGVSIIGYNTAQWLHTFEDDTVNGKPLLYVSGQTGGTLDCAPYGQIILADCEDVDVRNGVIANTTMGIAIGASSNCRVYDNDVSGNKFGILVSVSTGIHVYNNTAHSENEYGIHLNHSSGCTIEQNEIVNSTQQGINQIQSPDNIYHLNKISASTWGGFVSYESGNVTLTNNTVFENGDGIAFHEGPNSKVLFNIIHNNTEIGLTVGWMSISCTVYGNELAWNTGGNAQDDGSSNQWDDGISLGNFWSDYSGTGTYDIPGSAGSVDRFPYMLGEEYEPPTIATTTTTTTTTATTDTTTSTSTTSSSTSSSTSTTSPTTPTTPEPIDIPIETIVLLSAFAGAGIMLVVVYVVIQRRP